MKTWHKILIGIGLGGALLYYLKQKAEKEECEALGLIWREDLGICQSGVLPITREECTQTLCPECVCPSCGSYNVDTAPYPSYSWNWHWFCLDCDYDWTDVSCERIYDWESCVEQIGGII